MLLLHRFKCYCCLASSAHKLFLVFLGPAWDRRCSLCFFNLPSLLLHRLLFNPFSAVCSLLSAISFVSSPSLSSSFLSRLSPSNPSYLLISPQFSSCFQITSAVADDDQDDDGDIQGGRVVHFGRKGWKHWKGHSSARSHFAFSIHSSSPCFTALQYVTMCCNMLQCVTICYNVLQCVTMFYNMLQCFTLSFTVLQYVTI